MKKKEERSKKKIATNKQIYIYMNVYNLIEEFQQTHFLNKN